MRRLATTFEGLDSANEIAALRTLHELGQKLTQVAGQYRV